jgi:hypothetical protein
MSGSWPKQCEHLAFNPHHLRKNSYLQISQIYADKTNMMESRAAGVGREDEVLNTNSFSLICVNLRNLRINLDVKLTAVGLAAIPVLVHPAATKPQAGAPARQSGAQNLYTSWLNQSNGLARDMHCLVHGHRP